ncbi:MAG TPA: signal peptidase I [Desulfotomaculum sp.]|nr:signal peptidase I [Desulfotomaculum sp.]
MRRGFLLIVLIGFVFLFLNLVKAWVPVMAVVGSSMEPSFKKGDIIFIRKVLPSQVKVGDVIVFNVHPLIQEHYRYPAVVAHRVIELTTFQGGLAFKTKGDNTAEDPFVVPGCDLRGCIQYSLPYVGYALLYFQSREGMLFAIIALILLTIYLYANELGKARQSVQRFVFSPVIEQVLELERKQEQTSQVVSQAMEQFAKEYALHLSNCTSIVKELERNTQELHTTARSSGK